MSQLNKQQLENVNQTNFPNNNVQFITPEKLREFNTDIIDSMVDLGQYNVDSSSFSGSIAMLEAQVDALVLSGSGVVIKDEGVSQGAATTLNFVGPTIGVNVTGSQANIYANIDGLATTGSNTFIGNQIISGGLNVSGGFITVNGTYGLKTNLIAPANPAEDLTIAVLVGNHVNVNSNLDVAGTLTASLAEGYAWIGGAGDVSHLVATSSFIAIGTSGTSGTAGSSGSAGTSGTSATAGSGGSSGTSGSGGSSGSSGSAGTSGTSATAGSGGTSGTNGTGGSSGSSGSAGSSGSSGTGGSSGTSGSGGSAGTSGTNGTGGSSGTSGTGGSSGTAGTAGSSGSSGSGGSSGSSGTGGSSGSSGTAGTGGSSGSSGSAGSSGSSGTGGSSGTSGTDGTSGSTGTAGTSGTSATAGSGGTSGTNGVSNTFFNYQAKTTINSGDPATGHILWSDASQTGSTFINVSDTDLSGNNIDVFLGNIASGSLITLQAQNDQNQWQRYRVGTSTDNSIYWQYPTTFTTGSGVGFTNNQDILFIITQTPSGTSGTSGAAGTSGTTGTAGSSGTSSTAGSSGTSGSGGSSGTSGSGGSSGLNGTDGTAGSSGSSGTGGSSGSSGTGGSSGTSGTGGSSGISGTAGSAGTSGSSGTGGSSGSSGTGGSSGQSGTNGTAGSSGSSGTGGTSGTNGTAGSSGISGTDGTGGSSGTSGTGGTSGQNGTSGTSAIGSNGTSGTTGTAGTSGTSPAAGAGFPYTGSAQITGSLGVTGSISFDTYNYYSSGSLSGSFVSNITDTYTDVAQARNVVTLSSASYAALGTKDPNTIYLVSGSSLSGTSGTSGVGTNGTSGTSGAAGTSGTAGSSGTAGAYLPFTGSAQITGSLGVTGSISFVNAENNYFKYGTYSGSFVSNATDTYTQIPRVNFITTLDSSSLGGLLAAGTTDPNTLYIVTGSRTAGFPYTGSAGISGSLTITGSAYSNVVSASIASSTASLDFSSASFYTCLVTGTTFFNIQNVKPGQTANLLLTTTGVATASFSTNVKQVSGSRYLPTSGSGKTDILTFITFDSTNVYLAKIQNLV